MNNLSQSSSALGGNKSSASFVFDRVFNESYSQTAVYKSTACHLVKDFLTGTNVTIFAYGQTGTGKTHTMQGPDVDPGIITRAVEDIYRLLPSTGGKTLRLQYVQLYNSVVSDLLQPGPWRTLAGATRRVFSRDGWAGQAWGDAQ